MLLSSPRLEALGILSNAGLVLDERRGKKVFYSLRRDTLASLVAGYFGRF